jgi:TPP-dependent pyruvate/acetoin dehydrogenase alpha subunit
MGSRAMRLQERDFTMTTAPLQPQLALDIERGLRMYRTMVTIRLFEERVNDLYTRALMPGLAHLYLGE